MKTNIKFIKTDYWAQTILGSIILSSILSALVGWALNAIGWKSGLIWGYQSICFALLLLAPFGAWQVISGLINALNGDRLQKIYLGVVTVYFGIVYVYYKFCYGLIEDYIFLIMMATIAIIIAIWKYTVVRADYISLDIISVPDSDILDA